MSNRTVYFFKRSRGFTYIFIIHVGKPSRVFRTGMQTLSAVKNTSGDLVGQPSKSNLNTKEHVRKKRGQRSIMVVELPRIIDIAEGRIINCNWQAPYHKSSSEFQTGHRVIFRQKNTE